jgi:hypothetical protein
MPQSTSGKEKMGGKIARAASTAQAPSRILKMEMIGV